MLNYPQVYNLRSLALKANTSGQRSASGPLVHSCRDTKNAKLKIAAVLLSAHPKDYLRCMSS